MHLVQELRDGLLIAHFGSQLFAHSGSQLLQTVITPLHAMHTQTNSLELHLCLRNAHKGVEYAASTTEDQICKLHTAELQCHHSV